MKPTRYLVWYEITTSHGFDIASKDFISKVSAIKFINTQTGYTSLWERFNFHDITPSEDLPGLLWEYDEKEIKR
jgi:hypothetical protein